MDKRTEHGLRIPTFRLSLKTQGQTLAKWLNTSDTTYCLAALHVFIIDKNFTPPESVPFQLTSALARKHFPREARRIIAALKARQTPPRELLNAIFTVQDADSWNHLRHCEGCGKWIYGPKRKRFCNQDCQIAHWRRTQGRETRKKYMRRYRSLIASGKVRA
jgi:hypothetical protein